MDSLAVPPKITTFRKGQWGDLLTFVEALNRRTYLQPVSEEEEVLLRDDGSIISNGYRLSALAFRQLCTSVASGLGVLLFDLSGTRVKRQMDEDAVSLATAVRVFNLCVKLRFNTQSGPYGKQLVLDSDTKTVDGLLGPSYQYLPHATLLEMAEAFMTEQSEQPMQFHEAKLVGRRLELSWRTSSPLFNDPNGVPVYGGYHLVNSEAGECGVRVSTLLLLEHGGWRCRRAVSFNQYVAHTGHNFLKRLMKLLGAAKEAGEQVAELSGAFNRLASQPLRILDGDEISKKRRRSLARQLAQRDISLSVCEEIVRFAIYAGQRDSASAVRPGNADLESRSVYDIFVQLGRRSSKYPDSVRWQLEEIAYDLLSGKLVIK